MDSSIQVKKIQAEVSAAPKAVLNCSSEPDSSFLQFNQVSNSLGILIFTETAKNPEVYYAINPTDFSRPLLGLIIKNERGRITLPVNIVCCTLDIK